METYPTPDAHKTKTMDDKPHAHASRVQFTTIMVVNITIGRSVFYSFSRRFYHSRRRRIDRSLIDRWTSCIVGTIGTYIIQRLPIHIIYSGCVGILERRLYYTYKCYILLRTNWTPSARVTSYKYTIITPRVHCRNVSQLSCEKS